MYWWIALGGYLSAFIIAFVFMSREMAANANRMIQSGGSQDEIDRYYKEAGAPSLVMLIQSTAITGTVLTGLASLAAWLITR